MTVGWFLITSWWMIGFTNVLAFDRIYERYLARKYGFNIDPVTWGDVARAGLFGVFGLLTIAATIGCVCAMAIGYLAQMEIWSRPVFPRKGKR